MAKKKFIWLDGLLVVGLALLIAGLAVAVRDGVWKQSQVKLIKENDIQVLVNVYIDISGEVINPGVYEMKEGDRVIDVLKMAGGLSAEADRQWVEQNINRARLLKDGEKIYIPKLGEVLGNSNNQIPSDPNKSQIANYNNQTSLVNLNRATTEELDKLPGVGPAIAKKIIDYRQSNGGFVSVEEIKLVPGIGDKMYQEIKDLVEI